MTPVELTDRADAVLGALLRVVVGKEGVLRLVLAALLAEGHVLIEDVPGVAKTTIAASFGTALGLSFRRVQFTPDLLPADLTGSFIYDQRSAEFAFRRGPIFTELLLADEINRAAPKTQSALLEAMQEHQVTVEGESFPLQPPFLVIATQNPVELEGTYPLPEAELDRFLVRLAIGYPTSEEEAQILRLRRERRSDQPRVEPMVTRAELLRMQASLEDVFLDSTIETYIVHLVRATREDPRLLLGASPRASLALMKMARAVAALAGRDFVTPDDVKHVAAPVLAHRLVLRPENWGGRITTAGIVGSLLTRITAPAAELR
ncbi:MAG: MoxR family ATPase [Rhodospirillales bacterium]|nr:MoxR family ATPase [Rhodospirillales bacterium]